MDGISPVSFPATVFLINDVDLSRFPILVLQKKNSSRGRNWKLLLRGKYRYTYFIDHDIT
jgi:hypothetical protein